MLIVNCVYRLGESVLDKTTLQLSLLGRKDAHSSHLPWRFYTGHLSHRLSHLGNSGLRLDVSIGWRIYIGSEKRMSKRIFDF